MSDQFLTLIKKILSRDSQDYSSIVAGEQLQTFQAGLINSAGFHRPRGVVVTEKHIQEAKFQ